MRVAIDRAGRIVVPKALREELGLAAGQELEASVRDGRLELEPPPTPMRLEERNGHAVAVTPEEELPILSADPVRETLERVRR